LLPHVHAAELVTRFGAIVGGLSATRLLDYQPPLGRLELRAAVSTWLDHAGIDAPPAELLLTAGAQHALATVFGALCAPGDEVLVESLTYPGIKAVASYLGLRLRAAPVDREGLIPDALETPSVRGRARLLYCMPNVHNPTGITMSRRRRHELAAAAEQSGVTIVEDDVYGFLVDRLPALVSLAPERCIYVNSLSKSIAPALRMGFVRAPRPFISRIADLIHATTLMAPSPGVEVGAAWLADGTAERVIEWKRAEVKTRSALARRNLKILRTTAPANSPHLWVQLPPRWTADDFVREARARGVVITASGAFAVGRDTPQAVRVCLGAARDRQVMVDALRMLDQLARDPRPGFAAVI